MNIYVGNLPKDVENSELEALFAKHGTVEQARVIHDRISGESRGFGFVDMPNKTEAEAAMEALNGSDMKGRTLTVNEAREKRPRQGGFNRGGYNRGRR